MPLYSMTTFSDIRYSVAWEEGQRQQKIMDEVMATEGIESNWDSDEVEQKMLELIPAALTPIDAKQAS
jgi:kynurenine 3-monooxygenase